MSLIQCEVCGCVDNTVYAFRAWSPDYPSLDVYDYSYAPERKGKVLCSACGPVFYRESGERTARMGDVGGGVWHDKFPRTFLPLGEFHTNKVGNLAHNETGDDDIQKYKVDVKPEDIPPSGMELYLKQRLGEMSRYYYLAYGVNPPKFSPGIPRSLMNCDKYISGNIQLAGIVALRTESVKDWASATMNHVVEERRLIFTFPSHLKMKELLSKPVQIVTVRRDKIKIRERVKRGSLIQFDLKDDLTPIVEEHGYPNFFDYIESREGLGIDDLIIDRQRDSQKVSLHLTIR